MKDHKQLEQHLELPPVWQLLPICCLHEEKMLVKTTVAACPPMLWASGFSSGLAQNLEEWVSILRVLFGSQMSDLDMMEGMWNRSHHLFHFLNSQEQTPTISPGSAF